MIKVALDTNVLVYTHGQAGETKREISEELLIDSPVISAQVVSEYLNVMKRLTPMKKCALVEMCAEVMEYCQIQPVTMSTIYRARDLIGRYDFQVFDGIIVASALEAGCDVLYSADMQNGLIVNGTLKIVDPFV